MVPVGVKGDLVLWVFGSMVGGLPGSYLAILRGHTCKEQIHGLIHAKKRKVLALCAVNPGSMSVTCQDINILKIRKSLGSILTIFPPTKTPIWILPLPIYSPPARVCEKPGLWGG